MMLVAFVGHGGVSEACTAEQATAGAFDEEVFGPVLLDPDGPVLFPCGRVWWPFLVEAAFPERGAGVGVEPGCHRGHSTAVQARTPSGTGALNASLRFVARR